MISSQPKQGNAGIENPSRSLLDRLDHALRIADVEVDIPAVDHAKALAQVELPGPNTPRILADESRLLAQGARAETRAGSVGGRKIEGNTENGEIDSLEVLCVRTAQEAEGSGVAAADGGLR